MAIPPKTAAPNPASVKGLNLPELPKFEFPEYFQKKYPEVVVNFEAQQIFNQQLITVLRDQLD